MMLNTLAKVVFGGEVHHLYMGAKSRWTVEEDEIHYPPTLSPRIVSQAWGEVNARGDAKEGATVVCLLEKSNNGELSTHP
jgi:hypothetical protein